MLNFDWWARQSVEKHALDMRQFIDFRQGKLDNGMRFVEAYNGSGLALTLLPDRGLDIWTASYNGIPLTWVSPGSPYPTQFGAPWLRQFNGGLLTTCGLTHAGPPEVDPETGEQRDLHGNYTRLWAYEMSASAGWTGEEYVAEFKGSVSENRLFGEQLRLERTYRMTLGKPAVEIIDTVTNQSDMPLPFMILYHFNVGYPLVSAGVQLDTPHHAIYPRDEPARKGFANWADYAAAAPGYMEQVFFHHVKAAPDGWSQVALCHEAFGLSLAWDAQTLPYFTQWKNTREGIYVSGIEPGNCLPEGRNAARQKGRLVMLQPGEAHRFHCVLSVLDGKQAVAQAHQQIGELRASGTPVTGCRLDDYAGKG